MLERSGEPLGVSIIKMLVTSAGWDLCLNVSDSKRPPTEPLKYVIWLEGFCAHKIQAWVPTTTSNQHSSMMTFFCTRVPTTTNNQHSGEVAFLHFKYSGFVPSMTSNQHSDVVKFLH